MTLARGLVVAAVALSLAGCTSGGGANVNLLAPKLVVQARPDGNVTLFVHGAFREQSYDWIAIRVDNVTIENRSAAFSLERNVHEAGFFADVTAQASQQLYQTRARLDVQPQAERVLVAFQSGDTWGDPKNYATPFEHVLDHPKVTS